MPKATQSTLALNRGIISANALARIDLARTGLAAETMTNWRPKVLGPMTFRPGTQYLGATYNNAKAKTFPFVYTDSFAARVEITTGKLRVWVDDALVTRAAVTAAVTNGTFGADVTGWTDSDEAGAASAWAAGGYLALLGTGTNAAIRDQQVTVNQSGTEHALRIVVARGPVILRVGSTSAGDDYITETTLGTGVHSLTLTPSGSSFHIRLMNRRAFTALVDSVAVEGSGAMVLDVPWQEADLPKLRMPQESQSADVIYVACAGYQQRKIERRSGNSWSVVLYEPETGPFKLVNTSPITITPSALTGDLTLTASKPLFRSTHVGALFRIQSSGQTVTESITAEDTFSDEIRVAGVGGARQFAVLVSGTFVATVTLQYSIGEPGNWIDSGSSGGTTSWTGGASVTHDDELDNQIIYYRIGVKAGDYTSGTVEVSLIYSSGGIMGVARITGYSSSTSVSAVALEAMGATTASSDWWEGAWSDFRGWPTAVCLYEGRLWWAGQDRIYGSIVDAFEDFDDEFEGDSGPISRSIGEGPIQSINWLLPLSRLLVGTLTNSAAIQALKIAGNSVLSGRSSSFDEPLTPTNFNLKNAAASGAIVQRSGQRLVMLNFDINEGDYKPDDMSVATPDLCEGGITHIAVQYQPELRVYCLRADGTYALMTRERAENVIGWNVEETSGVVEDINVLPGNEEDQVYLTVRRTIDGSTVRYHEKFALESECRGRPTGYLADAHLRYSGAETTTITGLSHLEGEEVVVWGWNTVNPFTYTDGVGATHVVGRDLGTHTVSGGQITGLSAAVTNACVGLYYRARFKSAKQAFAAAMGSPLNQTKKIDHLGLIMAYTHAQGVFFGPDFDHLDALPAYDDDEHLVDENAVHETYDRSPHPFDDEWKTDARVCLEARAPLPATVLAFTASMTTHG
jgi:hypothetical protein